MKRKMKKVGEKEKQRRYMEESSTYKELLEKKQKEKRKKEEKKLRNLKREADIWKFINKRRKRIDNSINKKE